MITSSRATLHARGPILGGRSSGPTLPRLCPEHANDEIVAEDQPYAEEASPTALAPLTRGEEEHPSPFYYVVDALPATALQYEPAWSDSEVAKLLAISSPPPSPLSLWSSSPPQIPFPLLPSIPSPSLPLSPPSPVLSAPPPSPIRLLGYRAAMIRIRAEAAATSHSLPLPPPFILSPTRSDAPPPLTMLVPRLGIALGPRYKVGENLSAAAPRPAGGLRVDYGFVTTMDREIRHDLERYVRYGIMDSWDESVETLQGAPVSTDTELGAHMREFESMVRRDMDEIYTRLDDEQSQRQLLAGRVNMLFRDRRAHVHTHHLMETEARMSREAWGRSMDASDLAHGEVSISASKALVRDATRNGVDSHTSGTDGTEGVVELTQWFERMETVFRISNCSLENQIMFSTCTLLAGALTWWNSHVMTVTHDVAYAMTWTELRKKMTDKYYPRNEMKKLKAELWNLKVVGNDVIKYNQRFQELALLCVRMFPEESDKIKRYFGGLADMIHGNIIASKPKTMQEAIEMATELM
ncbi:reverse transcriptase domain-containing protein, partial [Tanacetum coccineum]